jgi:flagellar capping protein FliD
MTTGIDMSSFMLQNKLFMSQTLLSALNTSSSGSSNSISSLSSLLQSVSGLSSSASQTSNLLQMNLNTAAMALNSSNSTSIFANSSTPNTETLAADVTSFVKAFNNAVSLENASSDSEGAGALATLAKNNADSLEAIGITVGEDGKLTIDTKALADAIDNNPDAVEAAFNGSTSFAANVQSQAMNSVTKAVSGTNLLSLYTSALSSSTQNTLTGLLLNSTL